jgi:hypothetical protein
LDRRRVGRACAARPCGGVYSSRPRQGQPVAADEGRRRRDLLLADRTFGGKDRLAAFTSIGTIKNDNVYQADMGGGFHPFRRDVTYLDANAAPIGPLLEALDLTRGNRNWGARFRFGLVPITPGDFQRIATAMRNAAG